MSFFQFKLHT